MTTEIPAGKAIPGRFYHTPRKARVKVIGPVEGSTDVKVENDHGRSFTLPEAYPLILLAAEPNPYDVDHLAGQDLPQIREAMPHLGLEDLDHLEDEDPRPEVLELTAARRAELEGKPWPGSSGAPTASCHACGATVTTMDARGATVLSVHQAPSGSYCPGSGTPPTATEDPVPKIKPAELERRAQELEAAKAAGLEAAKAGEPVEANPHVPKAGGLPKGHALQVLQAWAMGWREGQPKAPAPDELETEPAPPSDPLRHLGDATTAPERIDAIRRLSVLSALDELEGLEDGQLQAKARRELGRQRKALEAMIEAGRLALEDGNQDDLKRLVARQDYQNRPGVLAVARATFAQLQGRGDKVDHAIQPVDPAELETDAPPAAYPEGMVDWLTDYTGRQLEPRVLADVAELTSSVRNSRAAIPTVEDRATVVLAYLWEATRPEPRPTILEQVGARLVALGGQIPEVPNPDQLHLVDQPKAPEIEDQAKLEADTAQARALMEGRSGAGDVNPYDNGTVAAELWALGRTELDDLVAQGIVKRRPPEDQAGAADDDQADAQPWDLSGLPLPDQVARSTTARALELVNHLDEDPGLVAACLAAERQGKDRPEIVAELEANLAAIAAAEAAAKAPELEAAGHAVREPKVARPAPAVPPGHLAVQVKDLEIVGLPDGSAELWAKPEGSKPVRVGDVNDPRLARHVAAVRAFQAEAPSAQPQAAVAPQAPPAPAQVVQVAQAGLAALAAALPALSALGVDVEIKITTRPPAS